MMLYNKVLVGSSWEYCIAMHELSIAYNLVEIADAAARKAGAARVNAVFLRVGVLSGVVTDALLFGYDIAARGTLLEGSRLEIEEVPLTLYCPRCDAVSELPGVGALLCPLCGLPTGDIRRGKELEVISVEIEDETEDS